MAPRHKVHAQAVGRHTPHGVNMAVEGDKSGPCPPVPQPDRCVLADAHEVRVAGEEGGRVDGRGVAAQGAAAPRRDGPQGGWGFFVNGQANTAGFHVQVDGVFGRQQVPQSDLERTEITTPDLYANFFFNSSMGLVHYGGRRMVGILIKKTRQFTLGHMVTGLQQRSSIATMP